MTTTPALDVHLLPDEDCWGPGYGPGRTYPTETLAEFAQYVSETASPATRSRLHADSPRYRPADQDRPARVPSGHDATAHPGRDRHS
ncbi:hypothetical protein OG738_09695 [Amycolatopsis sp. NBC_01488]|uniref:hypothetical protein n=1 Tax=Amycolatopsis sp. NBC_01488 TaxID=2903563 RepID=UPI002E2DC004|nr:hypothetical protein [Amycolatopsis sp. NBC_01488]